MAHDPAPDLAACVQALQDILGRPEHAAAIAEKALAAVMMRRMGGAIALPGRVLVKIPPFRDNEEGWAKWVIAADPKERGGYMFEGPFLAVGAAHALPVGAIVLIANGPGRASGKRQINTATAFVVQPNGELGGNPIRQPRGG